MDGHASVHIAAIRVTANGIGTQRMTPKQIREIMIFSQSTRQVRSMPLLKSYVNTCSTSPTYSGVHFNGVVQECARDQRDAQRRKREVGFVDGDLAHRIYIRWR